MIPCIFYLILSSCCFTGVKEWGNTWPKSLSHPSPWERFKSIPFAITQKCADLHNLGNGYNKTAAQHKLPISTVRAIIAKFKKFKEIPN